MNSANIRPFRIEVPESDLADLSERLARTRWPALLAGSNWATGLDAETLERVQQYWLAQYDWRKQESWINSFPQFQARVDDLDLHFFHIKSRGGHGRPLLLLHGWPGSQVEFLGLVDALTGQSETETPDAPQYDLVIPAIPGFGFGGKPEEPGWGPQRIAAAFASLMTDVLGYDEFDIQGGDWGTIIGRRIALNHPDCVRSLHVNMPYAFPPEGAVPPDYWETFRLAGTGYLTLQATRPDSLAIGNADSPMGLAGWILEKFSAWSDSSGGLLAAFDIDTLITNLMFYWLPNSAGSAARIYLEMAAEGFPPFGGGKVEVPTAIAVFDKEPYRAPREWLEGIYNVRRWTEFAEGGHFPALEQPRTLLHDLRAFHAMLES
ncbi:epoxide hydrolase family protein [Novosphingobium percolationis]|uniref:epoxide hydrolase family protein n=1 Tax=Novosphingobium percolationis TaxID=2871811 RepID=UPI001CD4C729|nr:epoxide hydrolase family protein [Novosphingobium percolationis]